MDNWEDDLVDALDNDHDFEIDNKNSGRANKSRFDFEQLDDDQQSNQKSKLQFAG